MTLRLSDADEEFLKEIGDRDQRTAARDLLLLTQSSSERKAMRRSGRRAAQGRSIVCAMGNPSGTTSPLGVLEHRFHQWRDSQSGNDLRVLAQTIDLTVGKQLLSRTCAEGYISRLAHGQHPRNTIDVLRLYSRQQRLWRVGRRLISEANCVLERTGLFLGSTTGKELGSRRKQLNDMGCRLDSALRLVLEDRKRRICRAETTIAKVWRSLLPKLIVQRLQDSTPEVKFRPNLHSEDRELVRCWHGREPHGDDRDRLEWARSGEKAALRYYEMLKCAVEDVSIKQLNPKVQSGWQSLDLRADERPLDVKNIRCDDPERYGEQLWKRHKRENNTDVSIVGTVSIVGQDAAHTECPHTIVLGEVSRSDVESLYEAIREGSVALGLALKTGSQHGWKSRVPGWMFEYIDEHYEAMPDWNSLDGQVRELIVVSGFPVHAWMKWMRSIAVARGRAEVEDGDTEVVRAICRLVRPFGLSRRTLFWFVLMWMLWNRKQAGECAVQIKDHLFVQGAIGTIGRSYPLGLYDPRRYVWNLIDTLATLLRRNPMLVDKLSEISLSGLNILKARVDGEWQTILAYCGICGRWPLYLDNCKRCPCKQARLVCDRCHHCGIKACQGMEYESHGEARAMLEDYPAWTLIGRRLRPPDKRRLGEYDDCESVAGGYDR